MSGCCNGGCTSARDAADPAYRHALWIALLVNASMFGVELAGGWSADSVSLLADAVDFLGDAGNYALSLFVLGLAAAWRSRIAYLKGVTMAFYGVLVIGKACWSAAFGSMPEPATMGAIGLLALIANGTVGLLLYAFRNGDANMRSVWLCTRNDAIGNLVVMLAALGVFGTGRSWPDLVVASIMALLALGAARSVIRQARRELRAIRHPAMAATYRIGRPRQAQKIGLGKRQG